MCGLKVGVDVGKAVIALIPAFLFILAPALAVFFNPAAVMVPFLILVAFSAGLYLFWVPLRIDELSWPSTVAAGRAEIAERKLRRHSQGGFMRDRIRRLTGRGGSRPALKALLPSYQPYRIPFPGAGRSLSPEQARANLDHLLAHKAERLEVLRTLLAQFGIDLHAGLRAADPQPFLEAVWQWVQAEWPSIHDPVLVSSHRFLGSRRDGADIVFSLIQDVALALGEMVLARRDDYCWTLDLDPGNRGVTQADGMPSWQRPVLLRPADAIVPIIFFDFEGIVHDAFVECTKPSFMFERSMIQAVLDALSGAHERFWRDEAARTRQG